MAAASRSRKGAGEMQASLDGTSALHTVNSVLSFVGSDHLERFRKQFRHGLALIRTLHRIPWMDIRASGEIAIGRKKGDCMRKLAVLCATASALTFANAVEAKPNSYVLSGTVHDYYGNLVDVYSTWLLDAHPVVDDYTDYTFTVDNVQGYFSYGSDFTATFNDLTFYAYGVFNQHYGYLFDYQGIIDLATPRLFSGNGSAPTLLTGDFTVLDYFSGENLELKVTSVPEPSSWAMMIAGFGMIGGALRARRKARVRFA